jgi:hypothetical protein
MDERQNGLHTHQAMKMTLLRSASGITRLGGRGDREKERENIKAFCDVMSP